MQDILDFLSYVWPKSGMYCLAKKTNYGWSHKVFTSIEEAAKAASISKNDAYYAVGSLKEPKVWNSKKVDKKTGETGAYEVRTNANMSHHACLIVDIDVGQGKDYVDKTEALRGLKSFCETTGFSRPMIVSSGYGFHCYWKLSEDVLSTEWQRVGNKLKAVAKHFDFRIDNTASADVSRVLRVVGTLNCKKKEAVPVKVVTESTGEYHLEHYEQLLDNLIEKHSISYKSYKPKTQLNDLFEGVITLDHKECSADQELIIGRCAQMQRCMEVGGPVGYEMRGHALSIIKLCFNKDYSSLSANDPDPDEVIRQNEQMLLDTVTDNPHLCQSFEETYPEGCKGCKWKAKIKSPIQLGNVVREDVEVKESLSDEQLDEKLTLEFKETVQEVVGNLVPSWKRGTPRYPLPKGFLLQPDGVYKNPTKDDDSMFPELLCPGRMYPYDIQKDVTGEGYVLIYGKTGSLEHPSIKVPMRILGDPKKLAAELCAKGMIVTANQSGKLVSYMSSYITQITNALRATEEHSHLGWFIPPNETPGIHVDPDPEKFVLPHCVIARDGVHVAVPGKKLSPLTKVFGKCGTLETWKEVANAYNRPGYEGYAFGVLTALGSPLMTFTEYKGAIISMVGDSAAGKSTVLRVINSFFGAPDSFLTQSDTPASFMGMLGLYGNIAITADEITDLAPERVSQLAYSIGQGRDKHAMAADRTIKDNEDHWSLLLASTSNRSLLTKLSEFKKESAAEAYRVFEFALMTKDHKMTKQEADAIFPKVLRNYGHAGEIYIKWVCQNIDEVRRRIENMRKELDLLAGITNQERYWAIAVCVNLVGGQIAKELGLIDYDMESIKGWVISQIYKMRDTTVENSRGTIGTLSSYLAESIGATISVGGKGAAGKPFYVLREPTQRVWNRLEVDNGVLYIDRAKFRSFINEGGGDYSKIRDELVAEKIILNPNKLMVLTKGSSYASSGQCHCFVLDATHQALKGAETVLKALEIKSEAA